MEDVSVFIGDRLKALKDLRAIMPAIDRIGNFIGRSVLNGNVLACCGNGGSMAHAMHLATEITVRFKPKTMDERRALPAIALGADPVFLTACGNDFGFNNIFVRNLAMLPDAHILVAITTSGTSLNVLEAVKYAKSLDMSIVALTGNKEAPIDSLATHLVKAPADNTAVVQMLHQEIIHRWAGIIEEMLFRNVEES